MTFRKPESMDECVYFTQRSLGENGEIMVWTLRQECPKCGKAKMGKPRDSKGKVKMRANEYACPQCSHTLGMQEYEDSLVAYAEYTCPNCGDKGEDQTPYKRINIDGVKTLRFQCNKCSANLDVTKKMKEKKRKKTAEY